MKTRHSLPSPPPQGMGRSLWPTRPIKINAFWTNVQKKIQKKRHWVDHLQPFLTPPPRGVGLETIRKIQSVHPGGGGGDAPQAMGWYVLFSAKILGLQPPNLSKHHFDHLFKRFLVRPCWAELPALFQQAPGVFLFFKKKHPQLGSH